MGRRSRPTRGWKMRFIWNGLSMKVSFLLHLLLSGRECWYKCLPLALRLFPVWSFALPVEVSNCIGRSLSLWTTWLIISKQIVPINGRKAFHNTTIPRGGGPDETAPVFVPAETVVIYSPYSLQRRKDIYGEDADQFRPERWGEGKGRGWEYVPFNGGPRICLGRKCCYSILNIIEGVRGL